MTMQIRDSIRLQGTEYSIIITDPPLLFSPQEYGITPQYCCTACYRGFYCAYSVENNNLLLSSLFIHSKNDCSPPIRNIAPITEKSSLLFNMRHCAYRGLSLPTDFTGSMLVGNGLIHTAQIEGILDSPWQYHKLLDLQFANGHLIAIKDESDTAKDIRKFIRREQRNSNSSDKTVHLSHAVLGFISDYPWWIKRY